MQEHWHPAVAGSRGSHPALYDGGGHALYDGGGPALYDGGAGFAQTASEDLLSEVQLLERQLKLLDGGSSFPQPVSHHGAPPRREEEEEEEEEEVDAGSESKSCLGCFGRPKRAASPPAVAAISAAQNAAEPARLVDGQRGPGPLVLPTIVFAQFAGTSLWFAPNAVVAQIEGFGGSELSILTSLVQVGFVAGTFLLSVFGVTDRVSAPILFGVMSLIGAGCNALCLASNNFVFWAVMRTLVGVCLAGIYPVGMRVAASQYPSGLGARLGVLVGALCLGTAFPWLVRGSTTQGLPYAATLAAVSGLACLGGIALPAVVLPRGTHAAAFWAFLQCSNPREGTTPPKKLEVGGAALREILSEAGFRAAALGYFGHMWELYAFWAFIPVLIQEHADLSGGQAVLSVPMASFVTIGTGAVSSTVVGLWSISAGRGVLPGSAVVATLCEPLNHTP